MVCRRKLPFYIELKESYDKDSSRSLTFHRIRVNLLRILKGSHYRALKTSEKAPELSKRLHPYLEVSY
jgi:hypothetical protein